MKASLSKKKIVNNNKLWFEKVGLPTVQDTLFEGFKLKSETSLKETVIIPVKNGKYPCYVHSYPADTGDDDFKYNVVNIDISYLLSASKVPSPLENTLRFSLAFNIGGKN